MSYLLAALLAFALCINKAVSANVGAGSLHYMYESVETEHENVKLGITGKIPKWLSGAKYQNGLGQFEGPNSRHPFKFNHQFDVMAMVYRWGVQNGEVTFSNKFVQSKYRQESVNGIPPYRTFGTTTPAMDALTKAKVLMNAEDMTRDGNLAINLVNFNSAKSDHLLAISDCTGFMEINMTTMGTIGLFSFDDELTKLENKKVGGAKLTTAHPQHLPNDDYMYSFSVDIYGNGMSAESPHNIKLFRVKRGDGDVKREIMISIPIKDIAYMHSFATTPNFIILVEFPLFYNMFKAAVSTIMKDALDWDPKRQGTRIVVIDKNTWEVVKTVQAKQPMWAYHHINAWEEEDRWSMAAGGAAEDDDGKVKQQKKKMKQHPIVTMDIAAYKDSSHLDAWGTGPEFQNNTYFMPPSTVQRLSVATAPGDDTVTQTTFSTAILDMPQINRGYQGHRYKYTYALAASEVGTHWNQLVKLNMETGEQVVWRKDDHWPSEPLFIPRPGGEDEDDGVVICTVLGGAGYDASYMLVLDAKTMTPLAEARAPIRIPAIVHGNWYDH